MLGDIPVLLPGFAPGEDARVRFPAKKQVCPVLGLLRKPVMLHGVAKFCLGLLLRDIGCAAIVARDPGPHYCDPALERSSLILIDFGLGRPGT